MSREEILAGLKEILHNIHPGFDLNLVTEDARLTLDLHIDSLSMMLLSLASEKKFNILFKTTKPFDTIGEVIDYIQSQLRVENKELSKN